MSAAAPAASADAANDRGRFFALLGAATLLPYLLFPLATHVLPQARGLEDLVLLCLFFGAGGHVMASFFFYDDPRVRAFMREGRSARYVSVPILLVAAAGLLFAFGDGRVRAYATLGFWIWQVHHFTRQNHGILAFASRAYRVPARLGERIAITLTDVAAVLATVSFVTPFRLTLLDAWGWHLFATGLGVYACAWIAWAASRSRERLRAAPGREAVLLALMIFYLPLFVFHDAFSAVYIYLTAHGLQYLVFMAFVARTPRVRRTRAVLALAAFTLVGGALLRALHESSLWGAHGATLMGVAFGITMWHFVLDAGVWRLSEPFQRGYMQERFGFLRG